MNKALYNCHNLVQKIGDYESVYEIVAPKKWMLVVDSSFNFLPDIVKDIYFKHKDNCVLFNSFTPNPSYEDVCKGVDLFKLHNCSLIVAIGGGSTIDVAKCIKLFSRLDPSTNYLFQKDSYENESDINSIVVPTTAGTGSEATRHAVIYFEGKKQSICTKQIIPDVVILEPSVLKTLPSYQKKATMFDALCQACESWWSRSSDDESIIYSKLAITKIIDNWQKYNLEGFYSEDVALDMLKAANCSGKAINITATTAAHAMSYKLSSLYNLPHGIAVALCFPVVWKHMLDKNNEELNKVFVEIAKAFRCGSTAFAILYFKKMLEDLGIKNPVSKTKEADLDVLVNSINPERLSNNPILFDKNELKEMYGEIVYES